MIDLDQHLPRVASRMRRIALQCGPLRGGGGPRNEAIIDRCKRRDGATGASLLFTFDVGYHTSGWWKNPDYERCFHLSIASLAAILDTADIPELDDAMRQRWAEAFFPDTTRLLWIEPPHSAHGKLAQAHHYRLFTDENGIPLLPRGEVYSRELTEAGWKSFSEVHAAQEVSP